MNDKPAIPVNTSDAATALASSSVPELQPSPISATVKDKTPVLRSKKGKPLRGAAAQNAAKKAAREESKTAQSKNDNEKDVQSSEDQTLLSSYDTKKTVVTSGSKSKGKGLDPNLYGPRRTGEKRLPQLKPADTSSQSKKYRPKSNPVDDDLSGEDANHSSSSSSTKKKRRKSKKPDDNNLSNEPPSTKQTKNKRRKPTGPDNGSSQSKKHRPKSNPVDDDPSDEDANDDHSSSSSSTKKKRRKSKKPDDNLSNEPPAAKHTKNKRREPTGLDDGNTPSGSAPKKAKIVKTARPPPTILLAYNTDHYTPYSTTANNVGVEVSGAFKHFKNYDGYTLYMNPTLRSDEVKTANIPRSGVRLDDRTAGLVLTSNFSKKELNQYWPAEFDASGMIRATRMPLGHASKTQRAVGETDSNGKVCTEGGWYYNWWGGLHCLMGKEGLDARMYTIRPSHETFLVPGMGWKIGSRAVRQVAD